MMLHEQDNKIRESILAHSPYDDYAEKSKSKVWEKVQAKQQNKQGVPLLKYASVIILAISLPVAGYIGYNLNNSNPGAPAKALNKQVEFNTINKNSKVDSTDNIESKETGKAAYIADNVNFTKKSKNNLKKEPVFLQDSNNRETFEYDELAVEYEIVDNNAKNEISTINPKKNKTKKRINISDLLAARKDNQNQEVVYTINSKINILKNNKKSKIHRWETKNQQQQTVSLLELIAKR